MWSQVRDSRLAALLEGFDLAAGIEISDAERVSSGIKKNAQGDDHAELKSYLRHCTAYGSAIHKQRLLDGGFNAADIGKTCLCHACDLCRYTK